MKAQYCTMIVKNMEESVSFYRDTMGFPIKSEHDLGAHGSIVIMDGGDVLIELIQSPDYPIGLYSIGIDVENLDDALASLASKGIKPTMPILPTSVGRMTFIEDPSGVRLALIEHSK